MDPVTLTPEQLAALHAAAARLRVDLVYLADLSLAAGGGPVTIRAESVAALRDNIAVSLETLFQIVPPAEGGPAPTKPADPVDAAMERVRQRIAESQRRTDQQASEAAERLSSASKPLTEGETT